MKRPFLLVCLVVLLAAPMHAAEDRADTTVLYYHACQPYYLSVETKSFWGKIFDWRAWSNRGYFYFGTCTYIQ